jgi:hypothetical protein
VHLLKDVAVDRSRVIFVFLGSHLKSAMHVQSILAMEGCYLHSLKGSSVHTKPLTDLFKKEKKFENFIIFFDVPNQD